jgi:hypothetical protein
MQGVAFNFYDTSFAVFSKNAASGRAFAAGRCVPGRFASYHVIGCLNEGKQIFFRRTAAGCQGNAAHTRNFEEGSPIHIKKRLLEQKKKDRLVKKLRLL